MVESHPAGIGYPAISKKPGSVAVPVRPLDVVVRGALDPLHVPSRPARRRPHMITCPGRGPSVGSDGKTSLAAVFPFGVVSPFEFETHGAEVFGRSCHGGPVPFPRPVGAIVPKVPDLRANRPPVHGKSAQGPSRSPHGRGRSPERFRDIGGQKCQTGSCKVHVSHGRLPDKAQGGSHAVTNSDTLLAPRGCLNPPCAARASGRVSLRSGARHISPSKGVPGRRKPRCEHVRPFRQLGCRIRATSRHRGHTLACTQQRTTEKGSVNRKNR